MDFDMLLEIKNLSVSLQQKKDMLPIVKDVSLSISRGSIVGLVGESGCGKSMTAKSINGILPSSIKVTGGSILWHGTKEEETDLVLLKEKEIRKRCGTDIAMIFQEPMTSLNPLMRVGDQISEVLKIHKTEKDPGRIREKAVKMLQDVGIPYPELRYRSWPHELSGGMRQRVMIAMAMIGAPKLLIADEATTALDVTTQAQILELIRNMCRKSSMSALIITHNMGVISKLCDYVYVMYLGRIMEQASVKELFSNPLHPYTKGLLSSIPNVGDNPEYLKTIPGNIPLSKRSFGGCEFCLRCSSDIKECFFDIPKLKEVKSGHYVRCHSVKETEL